MTKESPLGPSCLVSKEEKYGWDKSLVGPIAVLDGRRFRCVKPKWATDSLTCELNG